jgi:hypothetical protein
MGTSERSKAVGGDEDGPSRRGVKGSRSYEGGPTRYEASLTPTEVCKRSFGGAGSVSSDAR